MPSLTPLSPYGRFLPDGTGVPIGLVFLAFGVHGLRHPDRLADRQLVDALAPRTEAAGYLLAGVAFAVLGLDEFLGLFGYHVGVAELLRAA
jgi:hypothetical protein